MPWKWYDGVIQRIEDASSTTKRFWVEVPAENTISFDAGQFITMDLPISPKRLKRWRSYSIANHPDDSNVLEFCIVKLEGGAGTTYLFEEAQIGTPIRFKGPSGAFVLPNEIDKDLVFVCTGTGVAPFRSMIGDLIQKKRAHQNIHLIFGTRYQEGVLYQEEFENWQQQLPNFKYSIALSREAQLPSSDQIEYVKGYVHQIYQQHYAEVRPDVSFYLCGWSNMIDDAVAKLTTELGYDKSQIHYELYG